jgi:lipopolysaccharide export system protein LptC
MTIEANLVPTGRRYRLRSLEERERAFRAALRHTRLVGILRKVLPVLAVLVLACYFISTRLSVSVGDLTASISGVEIADGNLRMTNPKLKGNDKNNGVYVVSADYADQDVKNPKVIKLHAIKADLSSKDGGWSRMEAVRGVFDSEAERLVMQEKITVATSSGVSGELKHATLDMKNQTLRSHSPVHFELTNGNVKANALTFHSGEHTLIFRGNVVVHLIKPDDGDDDKGGKGLPLMPKAKALPPQAAGSTPEATAPEPAVVPEATVAEPQDGTSSAEPMVPQ